MTPYCVREFSRKQWRGAEMAPLNEESEDDETFYEGQIDETIFDENMSFQTFQMDGDCAVLLGF